MRKAWTKQIVYTPPNDEGVGLVNMTSKRSAHICLCLVINDQISYRRVSLEGR